MPDPESGLFSTALTRREFSLRLGSVAVGSSALGGLLAACGATSKAAGVGGTLTLLAFSGYDDPKASAPFRAAHHVTVNSTPLANPDEILTKLKAGGTGSIDLVTPNIVQASALAAAGVVQPLDLDRLPSTKHYLPHIAEIAKASAVGGKRYVTPYVWGINALVYDANAVSRKPTSWMDLMGPEYKKKIGLYDFFFDNYYTWARAFGYDPYALSDKRIDELTNFMVGLKQNHARTFSDNYDDLADQLARGDIVAIATAIWIVVARTAEKKGGKNITWTLPKEGGSTWVDSWAMPKDAPNQDTAYAWLNYMLGPEAQAVLAPDLTSGTVNADAVPRLSAAARAAYPYDNSQLLLKNAPAQKPANPDYIQKMTDAWKRVQAA